jgi:hypothetical protein
MTRIDANTYEVSRGEGITVALVATGVITSAAVFAVDGRIPSQPREGEYFFAAEKKAGQTHIAAVVCVFPDGTADTARIDVTVNGQPGPTISKSRPPHRSRLEFEVTQ